MDKNLYKERYQEYITAIETYLNKLFSNMDKRYSVLFESMRYSLLSGGKRIRPVLTLEFARHGGLDWHLAVPYACALELVHTYSLIHDDLPCMDNDDLRRGKPTNHKVFGDTLAILAGDALQPEAFRIIMEAPLMSDESKVEAAKSLAYACGANGMVAGQVLDTVCNITDLDGIIELNRLKTGVMIRCAAELGCIASKMTGTMRMQALEYASQIGKGFQIRDDILDVIGDEKVFGKPIGSDKEEGKTTYVNLIGIEACEKEVITCSEKAKDCIKNWPDHEFLEEFAQTMIDRIK